jgi:hypothetical protein
MSAATLLVDLEAAGVVITREGDRLRVRGTPGVDPAPYRDQIVTNKPAILRKLVEREIVAAVSAEPAHFDWEHYERLWQQWHAMTPDPAAELAVLTDLLAAAWTWLREHPNHSEHDAVLERWLAHLHEYKQVYHAYEGSTP